MGKPSDKRLLPKWADLRLMVRARARKLIFDSFGIKRIHIIGVSRSGTTIFQYLMVAYDDIFLANSESDIAAPFLGERLKIAFSKSRAEPARYCITKRNFGWFVEENVTNIINSAIRENIGIISIVRDPRDVLCSMHKSSGQKAEAYVAPEHWYKSVLAARRIEEALHQRTQFITIRYEDFVWDPDKVDKVLQDTFGLRLNDRVESISNVKTNLENRQYEVEENQAAAMHSVRNLDGRSIGKWRRLGYDYSKSIADNDIKKLIGEFIRQHSYPQD